MFRFCFTCSLLIVSFFTLSETGHSVPPSQPAATFNSNTLEAPMLPDSLDPWEWDVEHWDTMSRSEKEIFVSGFLLAINLLRFAEDKELIVELPSDSIDELDNYLNRLESSRVLALEILSYVNTLKPTPDNYAANNSKRGNSQRLYVTEGDYVEFRNWTWEQNGSYVNWSGEVENRTGRHCRPLRATLDFYDEQGRLIGTDRFINYDIRPSITAVVDGLARVSGQAVSAQLRPENCEFR